MTTSNWLPVALLTSGKLQAVAGKTGNELAFSHTVVDGQSLSNAQIPVICAPKIPSSDNLISERFASFCC